MAHLGANWAAYNMTTWSHRFYVGTDTVLILAGAKVQNNFRESVYLYTFQNFGLKVM